MSYVNSVTGPIDSSKLGRTLMHEHFLFGFCGFSGKILPLWADLEEEGIHP